MRKFMRSNTISQVLKDRLTPQVKHLDLKVIFLHQHKLLKTFKPEPYPPDRQLADFLTKPTREGQLQKSVLHLVGAQSYPPTGTEHHKLLELQKYSIGIHRGSFCHQESSTDNDTVNQQN